MRDPGLTFGAWLRRRRVALDLTRAELAVQVGCSVSALRKFESDELRPSRPLAEALANALQLAPTDQVAFIKLARDSATDTTLPTTLSAAPVARIPPDHAGTQPHALPHGTVTFLLTDIAGSTRLWEQHQHVMPDIIAHYQAILNAIVTAQGGVVFKTVGDGVLAAFAQAPNALATALAAQRAMSTERWGLPEPLQIRMALHSGGVELRDGDYFGPALNRAARLLAAGHGGQVLLSLATEQLVREQLPLDMTLRDLGTHGLKDLSLPERIFQLVAADLPQRFPALQTLDRRRTNLLAQPTALLGRDHDVAAVVALLDRATVRLVTLTGPGGIGKTRLSLQVAAELVEEFADGVYFVDLAPLRDPELVSTAIAETLGVRETSGQPILALLKEYLREKQLLLVLDNYEHLLDAAPLVAELLAHGARLKVLVTSRAVLNLRAEHEVVVSPLALPDLTRLPPHAQLAQYAAVALFIQRVQSSQPSFQVTSANAPAVAEICARLDGLPLAIELAAARVKLFPPEALLARLSAPLALLTGGARDLPTRQQTIRNTIAWSYNLLTDQEQQMFRQLGVFVGGWTLAAAEAVCNDKENKRQGDQEQSNLLVSWSVLDDLAALVDKSLLRQVDGPNSVTRFMMLETLREYAVEQLEACEELGLLQQRHAAFFVTWVEAVEDEHLLEVEYPNLRVALAWSQTAADGTIGLRLARALGGYWRTRSYLNEGRTWLMAVLEPRAPQAVQAVTAADHVLRAEVLYKLGILLASHSDFVAAQHAFEECLALFRSYGSATHIASALSDFGMTLVAQGEYEQSGLLLEESLALYQQLADTVGIMRCRSFLGVRAYAHGDWVRAREYSMAALRLARQTDVTWHIASALLDLSLVAIKQADISQARVWLNESIGLFRDMGERWNILRTLEVGAHVAIMQAEHDLASITTIDRAVRIFGAAEALRETLHNPHLPIYRDQYLRGVAAARAQLDEATFAAAWAAGRELTLEQAISEALKELA